MSDRTTKVLIAAPSLDILGGQAVQAQRILTGLRPNQAVSIELLPVNPRLPGLLGRLQRIKYIRTIVTSVAYLVTLLRRVPGCDVVHAFSASYWSFLLAPVPALLVAGLFRKRSILNYHSGEAADHLRRFGWHVRPLARLADMIVVPSGFLVETFARHGLGAIAIPNTLPDPLPLRRPHHDPRPRFLSNRNLEPMYGVATTLHAFQRIQAAFPEAELTIVGDGSQRRALESLASSLALTRVRFLGAVSPTRMAQVYTEADFFLNASRIDNMPLSIMEAFAAGLPVVTTRAGGIPWIVRHEENGLLVECDDAEGMAAAALRLLHDHELAARLARTAREEVLSRYTWAAVEPQWVALYQELAGGTAESA